LRHFRVEQPLPTGWTTAAGLQAWRSSYELSPVIESPMELGAVRWEACLSSDLVRAATTAKAAFGESVELTPLLREAEFAEFRTGSLKLPVWIWGWMLRLSWITGHRSQRACRDEFRKRIVAAADLIESRGGDILVVSHAGIMAFLSAELRRRDFAGPKFRMAEHAKLYLFERRSGWADAARAARREMAGPPDRRIFAVNSCDLHTAFILAG
jgi:broad specificity phosphatase PhoE